MLKIISQQVEQNIGGIITGIIINLIILGGFIFFIISIVTNISYNIKEKQKNKKININQKLIQPPPSQLIQNQERQTKKEEQKILQTKQYAQENQPKTERLNETIQIPIYNKQQIQQYQSLPYYLKDSVMTYHENILFSILSDFCQKYKFVLLSKVRLADFIQPLNTPNRKDYYHWFNRISAKHVDFLVCETETIRPLCAIELDDYTHRYKNRQDRDEFVDNVYRSIKLPILHIYEVREKYVYQELAEALNIKLDKQEAVNNSQ